MTKIDPTDQRILRILAREGRLPNLELAARIGLSPSACLRRVQELERAGVIKAYRAVIDPVKTGITFTAYITVGLNQHTKAAQEAFERAMARAPEVRECHNITGAVEYLLRVEASDLAAYKHFHTEILGALSGTRDYAMMLVGGPLRVIHVSTHVSLREACNRVKKARVLKVIELADESCRLLGIAAPRVAVAGLNPHAGEAGMFGTEEIEEITPAIEAAKAKGIDAVGPIAPDTVFYRAAIKGHFDIVVCMYHDQGHIPMKVLSFETGVNVTVGLPFIRTSVDHGTAFGKAGKGTADHRSLNESILLGAKMAETRRLNLQKRGG